MSLLQRRPLAGLLGAALAIGAGACSSINDPGTGTGGTPTTTIGIRFVQVVSDAANGVDVGLNGTNLGTALPFGSVSPPQATGIYVPVSVATAQYTLTATGSTAPFFSQSSVPVVNGQGYTLVALGQSASGSSPAGTLAVLADTAQSAASATAVLVRLFNAVDYLAPAGGDPVDVYVYAQGAARPSTPTVAALAWNARSAYLSAAPGNVQVDVFAAGAPSTGTPLFGTTITAARGAIRTVVLRDPPSGSVAGTAGTALVLADN